MRIDGFSSQSYPISRKPRKGRAKVDESVIDEDDELQIPSEEQMAARAEQRTSQLPARQQDLLYHRAMDRNASLALASYLSTAAFVDWDMEVLGLDLYI